MSNNEIVSDIEKFDRNMRSNEKSNIVLKWYSPMKAPFRLSGFAWLNNDKVYRRMPLDPSYQLPEAVDALANCTAGGQICFQSDSQTLSVRVQLSGLANMNHMPATGQCGFDCYVGDPGNMQFVNTTKYNHLESSYECILFEGKEKLLRNIVLNFPLYQGVKEVSVGVDEYAKVLQPPEYKSKKRIVFYGTSITQGGCAARPGMAYTNILSRRLNIECINLGFSGSGKGEPEVAETIAEIENPGCIVLDYEANCTEKEMYFSTLPRFIEILRKAHPKVPILVVSKIPYGVEVIDKKAREKRLEYLKFQIEMVEELNKKGDRFIYFENGSDLLGRDYYECTVDGVHPTDLGFMRIANRLAPVLEKVIIW